MMRQPAGRHSDQSGNHSGEASREADIAVPSSFPERTIVCPGCKGDSVYSTANPYRPFCSRRCKNNDFGAWASEAFRVAAAPEPTEDDSPAPDSE